MQQQIWLKRERNQKEEDAVSLAPRIKRAVGIIPIYPLRSTAATNLRGKGTQCDVTNNLAGDKLSPSLWDKFEGKLRVF